MGKTLFYKIHSCLTDTAIQKVPKMTQKNLKKIKFWPLVKPPETQPGTQVGGVNDTPMGWSFTIRNDGPVLNILNCTFWLLLNQCGIFEIDLVKLKENYPVTLCYLYLQKSRHLLIQRQQQSTFLRK